MVVGASIVNQFAALAGFMAAVIAVGGLIVHARPAMAGKHEAELRRATAIGGLCGLGLALLVLAVAAVAG